MLLKAGIASAGAIKKLFKPKKKTKKDPAKNLKQTKAVKKPTAKPRQKRSTVMTN